MKDLKREIERLQDANRRALKLADERAMEANKLRMQLEVAKKALKEIAAAPPSIAGAALVALADPQSSRSRMRRHDSASRLRR